MQRVNRTRRNFKNGRRNNGRHKFRREKTNQRRNQYLQSTRLMICGEDKQKQMKLMMERIPIRTGNTVNKVVFNDLFSAMTKQANEEFLNFFVNFYFRTIVQCIVHRLPEYSSDALVILGNFVCQGNGPKNADFVMHDSPFLKWCGWLGRGYSEEPSLLFLYQNILQKTSLSNHARRQFITKYCIGYILGETVSHNDDDDDDDDDKQQTNKEPVTPPSLNLFSRHWCSCVNIICLSMCNRYNAFQTMLNSRERSILAHYLVDACCNVKFTDVQTCSIRALISSLMILAFCLRYMHEKDHLCNQDFFFLSGFTLSDGMGNMMRTFVMRGGDLRWIGFHDEICDVVRYFTWICGLEVRTTNNVNLTAIFERLRDTVLMIPKPAQRHIEGKKQGLHYTSSLVAIFYEQHSPHSESISTQNPKNPRDDVYTILPQHSRFFMDIVTHILCNDKNKLLWFVRHGDRGVSNDFLKMFFFPHSTFLPILMLQVDFFFHLYSLIKNEIRNNPVFLVIFNHLYKALNTTNLLHTDRATKLMDMAAHVWNKTFVCAKESDSG